MPTLSSSGKLAPHFVQCRRMVPLGGEGRAPSSRMSPVPTRPPPTDPSPGSPAQKSTSWSSHQCLGGSNSSSSSNSNKRPANSQQQPGNLGGSSSQTGSSAGAGRPFPLSKKCPLPRHVQSTPRVAALSGKRASASLWPFAFLSLRLYHSPIFTYTNSNRTAQPNRHPPRLAHLSQPLNPLG